MGNFTSSARSRFASREKSVRLLLLGLEWSGKTTILHNLAGVLAKNAVQTTIPMIGFNIETLRVRGTILTSWDLGGGRDPNFRRYLANKYMPKIDFDGIIFVIDSSDMTKIDQARFELSLILNEKERTGTPLLVLCNMQDSPKAASPSKICCDLGLDEMCKGRMWKAVGCVAKDKGDTGLYEGIDWLTKTIKAEVEDTETISTEDKAAFSSKLSSSSDDETTIDIGYDPTEAGGNLTLEHFRPIKYGIECPFAKSAVLWGGYPIENDAQLTLEEQAETSVTALTEFVRRFNDGEKLDGFCIELGDPKAASGGPNELGECVRRVLTALSDSDPAGEGMMRVNFVGKHGWHFRFNREDFFITSFAPCYPPTSSRYAFGTDKAFILLQPMTSFARHGLPPDTGRTNWEETKTIRDKTRVAFRKAGRGYYVRKSTRYPSAEHAVRPIPDDGTSVVTWWKQPTSE